MILYHGSNIEIKEPRIPIQDKGRDFGFGFYTTTIIEQAERWAKRTARIKSQANGVNGTEKSLSFLTFEKSIEVSGNANPRS